MDTLENTVRRFQTLALLLEELGKELSIMPNAAIGILSRARGQAAERVFQMHVAAISGEPGISCAGRIFPVALLVLLSGQEVERRRQTGRHFLGLPEAAYGSGYRFGEFSPLLDAIHAIRFLERQFIAHKQSWEAGALVALQTPAESRFECGSIRFWHADGDQAWPEILVFLALPQADRPRVINHLTEAAAP